MIGGFKTPEELAEMIENYYKDKHYQSALLKHEFVLKHYGMLFDKFLAMRADMNRLVKDLDYARSENYRKREIESLRAELDIARNALATKKACNQRLNVKIDGLNDNISNLNQKLYKLEQEDAEMFKDLSALLSALDELLKYLDPIEFEEAKKMLEDKGFDVNVKYEITLRTDGRYKNRYFTSVTPVRDSECSW